MLNNLVGVAALEGKEPVYADTRNYLLFLRKAVADFMEKGGVLSVSLNKS